MGVVEVEPPDAGRDGEAEAGEQQRVDADAAFREAADDLDERLAQHDDREEPVAFGEVRDVGRQQVLQPPGPRRERDVELERETEGPEPEAVRRRHERRGQPHDRRQGEPAGVASDERPGVRHDRPGAQVEGHQDDPDGEVGQREGGRGLTEGARDADRQVRDGEHLREDQDPMPTVVRHEAVEVEHHARPRPPHGHEQEHEQHDAARRGVGRQEVAELDDGGDVDQVVEELEPTDLALLVAGSLQAQRTGGRSAHDGSLGATAVAVTGGIIASKVGAGTRRAPGLLSPGASNTGKRAHGAHRTVSSRSCSVPKRPYRAPDHHSRR